MTDLTTKAQAVLADRRMTTFVRAVLLRCVAKDARETAAITMQPTRVRAAYCCRGPEKRAARVFKALGITDRSSAIGMVGAGADVYATDLMREVARLLQDAEESSRREEEDARERVDAFIADVNAVCAKHDMHIEGWANHADESFFGVSTTPGEYALDPDDENLAALLVRTPTSDAEPAEEDTRIDRAHPPKGYTVEQTRPGVWTIWTAAAGTGTTEYASEADATAACWTHSDIVVSAAACSPAMLTSMNLGPGGMEVTIEHFGAKVLAHSFREMLGAAENYVEVSLHSREEPPVWMVVTVRRQSGKTPAALRREAEEECERLRKQLADAATDLSHIRQDWGDSADEVRSIIFKLEHENAKLREQIAASETP